MTKRIVALDPGKTTGYVCVWWEEGREFQLARWGVIPWEDRFEETRLLLSTFLPDYTVVESFRLYQHKAKDQIGNDFPSAQVIGIIQTYLHGLGRLDTCHLQPAALRTQVKVLPEHKEAMGSTRHVVDAYQHARYFIVVTLPKLLAV